MRRAAGGVRQPGGAPGPDRVLGFTETRNPDLRGIRMRRQLVACDSPVGRLGLTVCYDLRFPAVYQELVYARGAEVLLVPSAFTVRTGAEPRPCSKCPRCGAAILPTPDSRMVSQDATLCTFVPLLAMNAMTGVKPCCRACKVPRCVPACLCFHRPSG